MTTRSTTGDVFLWCLILTAVIVVLGCVFWFVRRWVLSQPAESDGQIWSLQQLRDLQARGVITLDEFERLKAKMLEDYRQANKSAEDADEPSGQPPPM